MVTRPQKGPTPIVTPSSDGPRPTWPDSTLWRNPLPAIDAILKRDEVDIIFVAGNVVLVALEIIEWPVAALALAVHAMARSRFKAVQCVAEVAEETE